MPKSSIPRVVRINLEVYNVIPIENIIRKYRNAVFFTIRLLFDEEEFFAIIIFAVFFIDITGVSLSSLAILPFGDSFSSSAYNKHSPAIAYEFIITQFKSKCCIFHVSYFTPDSRMKGENKSNSLCHPSHFDYHHAQLWSNLD